VLAKIWIALERVVACGQSIYLIRDTKSSGMTQYQRVFALLAKFKKAIHQYLVITGLFCLVLSLPVRAQFVLNFQPENLGAAFPGACNIGGANSTTWCPTAGAAQEADPDPTPFHQESVGAYWHQIIGDPSQGFAVDVYIAQGTGFLKSESGGRPSIFPNNLANSSLEFQSGNGWNPLSPDSKLTGNGTADPTRVVMRQILGGTWNALTSTWSCAGAEFCAEFLKDKLDRKPKISQTINDNSVGMSAYFELDMSNSTYSDNTTAGTIVNTVTFTGNNPGSFDLATDGQNSTVTGGRYTYSPGLGWVDGGGASGMATWDYQEGSYSYWDGSFDPLAIDSAAFRDATQNPWAGPGNEGKCDSGALAGTCP